MERDGAWGQPAVQRRRRRLVCRACMACTSSRGHRVRSTDRSCAIIGKDSLTTDKRARGLRLLSRRGMALWPSQTCRASGASLDRPGLLWQHETAPKADAAQQVKRLGPGFPWGAGAPRCALFVRVTPDGRVQSRPWRHPEPSGTRRASPGHAGRLGIRSPRPEAMGSLLCAGRMQAPSFRGE